VCSLRREHRSFLTTKITTINADMHFINYVAACVALSAAATGQPVDTPNPNNLLFTCPKSRQKPLCCKTVTAQSCILGISMIDASQLWC
jgi:hypothetical protein